MITLISDIDEVSGKGVCPLCGGSTTYLSTDLRPVFPEERLLTELLLKKEPFSLSEKSLWAQNSRYYFGGKSKSFSSKTFLEADCGLLSEKLSELKGRNGSEKIKSLFDSQIERFVQANRKRLNMLIEEAHSFIKDEAAKFPIENIVLSFSGGKDSTVTADIVTKALSNPSLVHIFGNTTLEFPTTIEYAKRFRENHPYAIFET
ncbi:MAG: phosphoadenosine phosphosulfate reductase family protein, partial [Treponema sp.]|nr:phosphoadenosine phosphosulfate reductase family protein [Treponema sp.]